MGHFVVREFDVAYAVDLFITSYSLSEIYYYSRSIWLALGEHTGINWFSYSFINGATNQQYTATANGSYAVVVSQNGCTDPSACQTVSSLSINEKSAIEHAFVYPNPTNGQLTIHLGSIYNNLQVVVKNTLGQEILNKGYLTADKLELNVLGEPGIYTIEILSENKYVMLKLIKI